MASTINTRDYRIILGFEDEQDFYRYCGNCPDNGFVPTGDLVHKRDVAAYRADRYIVYDMSVSEFLRKCPTKAKAILADDWSDRWMTPRDLVAAIQSIEARDAYYARNGV